MRMLASEREVDVAVDADSWLRGLQHEALRANRDGLNDTRLAYSIIAVGAGQPVAEDAVGHRELVQRIAWTVFVRAPALDLRWLIKGVLDLDKVYWGVFGLASLLDKVRALEADPGTTPCASEPKNGDQERHRATGRIRQTGGGLERIVCLRGEQLRAAVTEDIAEVKRNVADGDLLDLVIEDRGRAGRRP